MQRIYKNGKRIFYKEVMNELIAKELMTKGYQPVRIRDNNNEEGKKVYAFEKTSKFTMDFLKAIDKIERGVQND